MDSTKHTYRWIVSSLATVLLALGLNGCTSSSTVGGTAPHSNVSRDNALALAKHVAASIGGRVYAVAPSGSMLPTLDAGSIVTIEKVTLDKLHKGDIIIYRNAAGLAVIHRLYENHGNCWYVLGDNNAAIDSETVSANNFIGRVCAIFYTSTGSPTLSTALMAPSLTAVANAN
jgi:signal peptidase I